MQIVNGEVIYSPSDITSWMKCQWGYVRKLDSKLGKGNIVPPETDAMMQYSARQGNRHERYFLTTLQEHYGKENVFLVSDEDLPKDLPRLEKLTIMDARTADALKEEWPVVFQASFFDGKYTGFADFLEFVEIDGVWAYQVLDTKLALSDKLHVYDLQLASYARHLKRLGIPVHDTASLVHGNLKESTYFLPDIYSRLDLNLDRLNKVEAERRADPLPIAWLSDAYKVCGECASCVEQKELDPGDLLHVAGLGPAKRNVLVAAGINRIPELAQLASSENVDITPSTLQKLTTQAQRQWRAIETNDPQISVENPAAISALPPENEGDLYFDFETDPIFYVEGSDRLGIAYLYGLYSKIPLDFKAFRKSEDGLFQYLWADSRDDEENMLYLFMMNLMDHLREYPDAHIYHYSPFEITTLKQLVFQENKFIMELQDIFYLGKFVDLKSTVTSAVSHGLAGYSIKQLEPLYMGKELRTGTKNATASITRYDDYHRTLNGEVLELGETADEIREDVLQYNRYDCYSMLKLRNWLDELARSQGDQID